MKVLSLILLISILGFSLNGNANHPIGCRGLYELYEDGSFAKDKQVEGLGGTFLSFGVLLIPSVWIAAKATYLQSHITTIAKILRNAARGKGPELNKLVLEVKKKTGRDVSVSEVAKAVNSLNKARAFCPSGDITGWDTTDLFITVDEFTDLVLAEVEAMSSNNNESIPSGH